MALLAGDIILLWRIHFGTFTTETWFPKYFEYTLWNSCVGTLEDFSGEGLCLYRIRFDSLDHINATMKKPFSK